MRRRCRMGCPYAAIHALRCWIEACRRRQAPGPVHIPCASLLVLSVVAGLIVPLRGFGASPAPRARSAMVSLHQRRDGRVRSAARPIDRRLPEPLPFMDDGRPALRMDTQFDRHGMGRAAWDIPVRLDLRHSDAVQFQFRGADTASVSYFSIYFRSGDGWYAADFTPAADGRWETIRIRAAATRVEGNPAGWGRVSAIRIAAWRLSGHNARFDIAAFEPRPVNPAIVVVRGVDHGFQQLAAGEKSTVLRQARRTMDLLDAYRLHPGFIDEPDLSPAVLRRTKVVVLPYNPLITERAAGVLAEYVERGGAVVGFYTIHPELQRVTGIRKEGYLSAAQVPGGVRSIAAVGPALRFFPAVVGQTSWNVNRLSPGPAGTVLAVWRNQQAEPTGLAAVVAGHRSVWMSHVLLNTNENEGGRLLVGMLSVFAPDIAGRAASGVVRSLGAWSGQPFNDAVATMGQLGRTDPAVQNGLRHALYRRQQAMTHLDRGRYWDAVDQAHAADRHLRDAYFRTRIAPVPEFRAVWCDSPHGIKGWDWERSIRHLRAAGFNRVFPHVLDGWSAWYPSAVLEARAGGGGGEDPLQACIAAGRRHGVEVHVWMKLFRVGDGLDAQARTSLADRGLLQVNSAGRVVEQWLCPNAAANRRRILQATAELAGTYAIDGLHLDYVRYAGADACFCAACRARFERQLDRQLTDWPAAVLPGGAARAQWLAFRAQVITEYVRAIGNILRSVRPQAKLSAAVFTDPVSAVESIGQPWGSWARHGHIDFLCPMNYEADSRAFARLVAQQQRAVSGTGIPVFPGIGVSAASLDAVGVVQQIEAARRLETQGFVLFRYGLDEAETIMPELRKGATRPR